MFKLNKLRNKEIKSISRKIQEKYESEKLQKKYAFFINKKNKVYIINKTFLKARIKAKIDALGIYFCKLEKDGIRLSIEGSMLVENPQKNVIKLNKKQFEEYMRGNDLDLKVGKGYVLLEYNKRIIGCGKATQDNIQNFVPKARRMY
jgi:NOL1/NOP2/fmu family ribosome biogenesis protein